MNHPVEDPAVIMARRALFGNNSAYYNNGHIMTHCYFCDKRIMTKGSHIKVISGKKRHICPGCFSVDELLEEIAD